MLKLSSNLIGYTGELLVMLLLKIRLQKILYHRYRTPVGEVDIIAQKGNLLFFIEVKTSIRNSFNEIPLSAKQRRSITRAAKYFLVRHPKFADYQMSFEVYCLSIKHGITRIQNAWEDTF
ncbi:YraN family protein [Anaplasma phagocytophilum]|uniref:YraN family protein n=1 Tax=Anaplasma phagocytophilum TaxID=948 RepID=UPI0032C4560F|nr:hypothetical protein ESP60_02655 [Anaplasma phagocytophilum]